MSYFEHWLHKSSFENGSLVGVAMSRSISHSHKNTSHKTTYSQLCRHEGICTCHDHSGCSIEHVMVSVQNPCKKQVSYVQQVRAQGILPWLISSLYLPLLNVLWLKFTQHNEVYPEAGHKTKQTRHWVVYRCNLRPATVYIYLRELLLNSNTQQNTSQQN